MTPAQVRQELGELLVRMSHQDAEEPSRVVVWTKVLISLERDLDWADREVSLLRKVVADIYRALAAGKAHAEAWTDAVDNEWGLEPADRETMLGMVAAIEAEAAQQALDGAALALGLLIEPTKMSRHYIEAAFARVEHHVFAAERARIADAVRGLDGECHDGEGLGCDTSPCVVNVSRAAVLAIINPEETP